MPEFQEDTNSLDLTQAQSFQLEDKSSLHRYRTECPNIIFELGLNPYELSVYLFLKRVAGDNGACFMSLSTLEEKMGISQKKIREAKITLSQPFEKIGGKPLIKITQRMKSEKERAPDLIQIIDIWPENMMGLCRIKEKLGGSQWEGGVVPNGKGGGSQNAEEEERYEEEPYIKNDIVCPPPLEKEPSYEQSPSPSSLSSSSFKRPTTVSSFDPATYKLANGKHLSLRMQRSLKKYDRAAVERLYANLAYYQEYAKKSKNIKDHERYLQDCINKDYAAKQTTQWQNDIFAKIIAEENPHFSIKILKTVVQIGSKSNQEPLSISKDLPPETFANILENAIRNWIE